MLDVLEIIQMKDSNQQIQGLFWESRVMQNKYNRRVFKAHPSHMQNRYTCVHKEIKGNKSQHKENGKGF